MNRTNDGSAEVGTQHGLERFSLLTDAVVAIAIALLVLPLVEIGTAEEFNDVPVGTLLSDNAWKVFSFFLSFAVIGRR